MRSQPTRNSGRETRAAKRSAFQVSVSSRNADTSANAPHGPTCAHAVSRAGTSASSPKAPKSETHSHDASDHEGATPRASNTVRVARRTCASVTSGEGGGGGGGGDAGASGGGGGARAGVEGLGARAPARARAASTTPRDRDCGVCGATPRVLSRGLKLAPRIASFGAQQRARGDGGFRTENDERPRRWGPLSHRVARARVSRASDPDPRDARAVAAGRRPGRRSRPLARGSRASRPRFGSVRAFVDSPRRFNMSTLSRNPRVALEPSAEEFAAAERAAAHAAAAAEAAARASAAFDAAVHADAMASIAHHETSNGEKPAPTLAGAREPKVRRGARRPPRPPRPRLPSATRPRMRRRTRRAPIRAGTTRGFRPRRRMRSVVKRRPRIGPPTRRDATPTARIARPTTRTA